MNKKIKGKYLAGYDLDLENKEVTSAFLRVQGVNKKGFNFFKTVQAALEVKGTEIYRHDEDGSELLASDVCLPLEDWPEHELFFLEKNNKGTHQIGGPKPKDLIFPTDKNLKTQFHYIGSIDGTDSHFRWLGVNELPIIFPMNECNFGIYLDYSNPQQPVILNSETFTNDWFDVELDEYSPVVFKETRYRSVGKMNPDDWMENDEILLCGVPLWYQYPEIPHCPKTGEVMKYVCTINSDAEIGLENESSESGRNKLAFGEYLCFGDHGHLFVFYHPESKILHLNMQF